MIPHDPEAEALIIAAIVANPDTIPDLAGTAQPDDFYSPAHGTIFRVAVDAWSQGLKPDGNYLAKHSDVTDAVRVIADALVNPVSRATAQTNALRVADLAATRRIQAALTRGLDTIQTSPNISPVDTLDLVSADLGRIDIPNDNRPIEDLWHAADMVRADFPVPDELIPGFLRRQDRLMLVGLEGGGKSWTMRWIASKAAAGIIPFTGKPMPPIRALIIDGENQPADMRDSLMVMHPSPDHSLHVLSRPGGLDIRRRTDRSLLHRVCEQVRPDLIAIGPLYKIGRSKDRESDEDTAVAIQQVLDEIRVRFDTALILEHHAPKGTGKFRELVPFGSSAWYRWPEFGWKLIPYDLERSQDHPDGLSLRIDGFRRDRHKIDRPERLDRSKPGPWSAVWPTGYLHRPTRQEEEPF